MRENLDSIQTRIQEFWANSPPMVRYISISTVAVVLIALVTAVGFSYRESQKQVMAPLFMDLAPQDASVVKGELDKLGVHYEFRDAGKAIWIPKEKVVETRLGMAAKGVPNSGVVGMELFDSQDFSVTDFTQQVNLRRALEGELSRTIGGMDVIDGVRVHISMEEPSLFVDSSNATAASVALKLKPKIVLEDEQIKAIVHLVSSSVKGLKPENVTVVDQKGNLLSDVLKEEGNQKRVAQLKKMQLEMKNREEDRLQQKIQSALEIMFGKGKVVTRATVEMDFDQQEATSEVYEPVVEESGIPRSAQTIKEEFTGQGTPPEVGIPGTTSNIPGYKETTSGQNNYKRSETTTNYEVTKTVTKTQRDPGVIRRVSIAVLLDANDEQFNQQNLTRLRQNVAAAGGLNLLAAPRGRGDQVNVFNFRFNNEEAARFERDRQAHQAALERRNWIYIGLLVFGVVIAAILTIILMRSKSYPEVQEHVEEVGRDHLVDEPVDLPIQPQERVAVSMVGESDATDLEAELAREAAMAAVAPPTVSEEEAAASRMREAVFDLVDTKPEAAAFIIKNWLMEEE